MKILICGHKSFAAKGLAEILRQEGHDVDCFSRGEGGRSGSIITGNVFSMAENACFNDAYDMVINFIIIKDGTVDANLAYMSELIRFCLVKAVKRLVQISSISVYPNETEYVREDSVIESRLDNKGSYAAIKVAVDQYLLGLKDVPFGISYVRPGFIVDGGRGLSLSGILIRLPIGVGLLLGSKQTTLPLLERSVFHRALSCVCKDCDFEDVYLMFSNRGETKYSLAKSLFPHPIVVLPRLGCLTVARWSNKCGLLKIRTYHQLVGLFKVTKYDSSRTSEKLKVSFDL